MEVPPVFRHVWAGRRALPCRWFDYSTVKNVCEQEIRKFFNFVWLTKKILQNQALCRIVKENLQGQGSLAGKIAPRKIRK